MLFATFMDFSFLLNSLVLARNNHLRQAKISVLKACRLHFSTELFGDFNLMLSEHLDLRLFEH